MKLMKKALSVFMAALMIFSVMSISLVSYAAEADLSDSYKALAYSFFNYTKDSSLGSNNNVIIKDDAGIPSLTILGDLSYYTTSTESGNYKYADDKGNAIRSIAYTHKVTAKDDGKYTIRNAANTLLGIVDNIISYEYGVGLYTVPMIIEEITNELSYFKGDDGEYLFLDGYTYYTNVVGDIVARSAEKTYTVEDDGDIVYDVVMTDDLDEEATKFQELVEQGVYKANTLLEICDLETVVKYMCGNFSSVNSGNWFHDFVFYVYTDIETVLISEGANLTNANITLYETTVTWNSDRQFDDSGLKAQYYNLGYTKEETSDVSSIRVELKRLDTRLNDYFNRYYAANKLDYATNSMLINTYYSDITNKGADLELFNSISDAAKIAVFGQRAYSYVNLVTQLTPIVGATTGNADDYAPVHTYAKYKDKYDNNIQFKVTTERVSSFVSSIDALLQNPAITKVLSMFLDLSEFGVDLEANANMTPQEAIIEVINNMVFSDDIVNMLLEMVYPMVANLLDENLTDGFINGMLEGVWDGLDNIVNSLAQNGSSWNALIYGTLAAEGGIFLTPAGLAWCWNEYGYTTDSQYSFCDMKAMHDMLKAAKGGKNNDGAGHSTGEYYAIGCQYSEYYLDHWRDVDWSQLVWNINGSKQRFLLALDAALSPLVPLLAVLFGDAQANWEVTSVIGIPIRLVLNEGNTFHLYSDVLGPLFETLGITHDDEGLITGEQFETNAKALQSKSGRNGTTIATFLNDGILSPLLNWVTDELLADPIQTVMSLLPNLSYYLTSGQLLSVVRNISVPIKISVIGITIEVYSLNIAELLGDALDFLTSVQGILEEVLGLSVETNEGIVGYYSEASGTTYKVYTPDTFGYDPNIHNIATSVAYKNAYGDMNLYPSNEYTIEVSAMDENGEYTEYALRSDVGYLHLQTNKIVTGISGNPDVYRPLKEYYQYEVVNEFYDPDQDQIITTTSTYKVATLDEVPEEYKKICTRIFAYVTMEHDIALPAIMDYKLQACGTLVPDAYSVRFSSFSTTDREGNVITWPAHQRSYIKMTVTDKNGTHESYGLVFLFLLRYILSALGYSQFANGSFVSEYTLLDAFGLDDEMLNDELISGVGLSLGDIIYHVCLNPDAIIAALFELFIGGEEGSLFTLDELGNVIAGKDYSYPPTVMETYADEIMDAAEEYGDYHYGTSVLYNEYWSEEDGEYLVDNLDDVAENVLAMLKLEDMESLSGLLEDLLVENVFNNEMVTMIVDMVYSLLGSLDFDLGAILNSLLGVDYSKKALIDSLAYKFKDVDYTSIEMYKKLNQQLSTGNADYGYDTFRVASVDMETGDIIEGDSYDWGFNNPAVTAKYSSAEIFLRALSAAFGPFSILVEYIFMGEDINLLDIVHIPMYEIYNYAWIPLMEALSATDGLVSFRDYYTYVFANPYDTNKDGIEGGTDAFYYLLQPIVRLAENLIASPIETVLNLIPNLIFVLSIGGLNSIVNNIAHFAYVLLDILEPVVDAYPVVNSLLSNLDLGGVTLNLSLPLNVDLNQLVNELLEGLLGSALSFEIENDNVVVGTQTVDKEVDVPVYDANGNQLFDVATGLPLTTKEWQTVTEDVYAVGVLNITLPYLDLTTLCSGEVTDRTSVGGYRYIYLNSSGGADFITLVFRLVTDTLFYQENWENIANFLVGFSDLDDEDDNDALLMEIFMYIHSKAKEVRMNDILMKLILTIYKVLVPIADMLGERFQKVDFGIADMFDDMDNIGTYLSALMDAGENKNETLTGFAKIIQMIKDFFNKLILFFQNLFK